MLCRQLNLFTEAIVAIDGSKFKAVNNRDKNFTERKLKARMQQLEESIERYLTELDRADREPSVVPESAGLLTSRRRSPPSRRRCRQLGEIERQMLKAARPAGLTDRSGCAFDGHQRPRHRHRGLQRADRSRCQAPPDRRPRGDQRRSRPHAARLDGQASARGDRSESLTALADRGYFEGEEILECERAGITALVPKPLTSNNKAEGRFDKRGLRLHRRATMSTGARPASARIRRFTTVEKGKTLHKYWSSACPHCPIKSQCTTGDYRRITRWEHEKVLEAMQERLDRTPEASRLRRQTVEHPFGTLKAWMGSTHFLTKTLPRVRTEMSLHVLAYNLKRAMNILGTLALIDAMRT